MEAARKRRIEETQRRNLQQRTAKNQRSWKDNKIISRMMAKEFLKNFRRDTFSELRDQGILRDPRQYSLISHFMPAFLNQTKLELMRGKEYQEGNDSYLMMSLRGNARRHKDSIKQEKERIEEKRREEFRIQKEKEEAKRRRREERAARRERQRVMTLRQRIIDEIVAKAETPDTFNHESMRIYDVREPGSGNDGIYLIGGVVGEMMLTFTCLHDYILANPSNSGFEFKIPLLEEFLKEMLVEKNFPDGAINLNIKTLPKPVDEAAEPKEGDEEQKEEEDVDPFESMDDEAFIRHCLTPGNINDYGLAFFFKVYQDLVISKDFIECLYRAIIKIARSKERPLLEIPEVPELGAKIPAPEGAKPEAKKEEPEKPAEGDAPAAEGAEAPPVAEIEVTEEMRKALQEKVDANTVENELIVKYNEELAKIKAKISITPRDHDFTEDNDCAIVKLNNYRENKPAAGEPDAEAEEKKDDGKKDTARSKGGERVPSPTAESSDDAPQKLLLVNRQSGEDLNIIVYHTEGQSVVRHLLIELAKKHFKELGTMSQGTILGLIQEKS